MSPFTPLRLPNGAVIPNRIAKAAMEENMADAVQGGLLERLLRLYQAWADGGAGLILSGNVMVDRRAMTGPGGVVLEDDSQLDKFRRWAGNRRCSGGAQFWLQINHPGRQMQASLGQPTWAPSAVALELGSALADVAPSRGKWASGRSPRWCAASPMRRGWPSRPASAAWRFMPPTATC